MIPNPKDKKICGIYSINNIVNNKRYIGKSKNIYFRIKQHVYDLKTGRLKNENDYMRNSWNKYSQENFTYEVIEILPKDDSLLNERELYWINYFRTLNREFGYNLRLDSSSGMITSKETSEKITAHLKREWASGIRSGHGARLKKYWEDNVKRRNNQGQMFTNILTKYCYNVYDLNMIILHEQILYKQLLKLGLDNSLNTLRVHNDNSNITKCKNFFVKRIKIEDIVRSS